MANRKTNTNGAAPTLTPEALAQLLAQIGGVEKLAEVMKAVQATHVQDRQERSTLDYDHLCVKAFAKAGFGNVTPRVDTKTYNLWLEAGFKVKPGEKAIRIRKLRLFHKSQVVAMSKAEKAEALTALAAKREGRTSDKLPKPSPVEPAKPAPAKPAQPTQEPAPKAAKPKGRRTVVPINQASA